MNMDSKELRDKLFNIAKRDCWTDGEDFNPYDFSGGNFDDAYSGGVEDGRAELARELLKLLFNEQIQKGD